MLHKNVEITSGSWITLEVEGQIKHYAFWDTVFHAVSISGHLGSVAPAICNLLLKLEL